MKKILVLISVILLCTGLVACEKKSSDDEAYVFEGQTMVVEDNRKFELEDLPENNAEETVGLYFLYSITGDYEAMSDILADIEVHKISLENKKKQSQEGDYIQSYVIHDISTLTEEEYSKEELENGDPNIFCYYGWKECVEQYNLIEFEIISVNFTQIHSEKSKELLPQWGDGTYTRSFIVGKTAKDKRYKIYDFGMM